VKVSIAPETAVTVMLVSGGYPGNYAKGKRMEGLDTESRASLFHAGTKQSPLGVVTDGGRVLAVTGMGSSLEAARQQTYQAIQSISFEGAYFRRDIGVDLLQTGKS
jgi:phosphoribosylamine--glycine ligase